MAVIQMVCSDPRYPFLESEYPGDQIFVPVPGVNLGDPLSVVRKLSIFPEDDWRAFKPHYPCAAMKNPGFAEFCGQLYTKFMCMFKKNAFSIFLGRYVGLYNPLGNNPAADWLFAESCSAQRKNFGRNENVCLKEMAIAPFFMKNEIRKNVLYYSSLFPSEKSIAVLKEVCGGILPPLNFSSAVENKTKDWFYQHCSA